ncbi:thioredoxin domain-containing protein [Leptospira sp. 96542]|nr:thioredoxin domain-containing protein [Leptospira sp. 96542]
MNRKNLSVTGFVLGLVGLVLSFLLAVEYFGLGSDNIANAACSALGGGDSCLKVAGSGYSAIPNVPFLGNIPIALLGFGFYGLVTYLFYSLYKSVSTESVASVVSVLLFILGLGLLVDIILLGVSVFLIETICRLCFFTYLVTIASLIVLFLLRKTEGNLNLNPIPGLKEGFLTIFLAFFFSFSFGYASSKMVSANSGSQRIATSQGLESSDVLKKIAEYENGSNLNLVTKGYPSIGKKDAPITIVKFADFNCGHCLHTSHMLHTVLSEYDGMVKVVYKNFPLDGSCNRLIQQPRPGASSCVAAIASICADKQGKFEPMYRGLYDNTEKGVGHTTSTILNLANSLSLNMNQLKSCMGSREAMNQLNAEIDEAERLQIQATPSLFINDKRIDSGTPNPIFLKTLLDSLIKKI